MSYLTIRDHPPCQENLWAAPESHRHSPATVLVVFLENFPEWGQFSAKNCPRGQFSAKNCPEGGAGGGHQQHAGGSGWLDPVSMIISHVVNIVGAPWPARVTRHRCPFQSVQKTVPRTADLTKNCPLRIAENAKFSVETKARA